VLLGDLASTTAIHAALDQVERDANDVLAVGRTVATEYQNGTAPFQDHVHVRAFVFDYLTTHATGMLDWVARTRAALAEWPHLNDTERAARAITRISEHARRLPPNPPNPDATPTPSQPAP
jgi:hypothetical protein